MTNNRTEKFDVVIVGAGPAGSTAALFLAKAGLDVAIFERGEEPGQKNMFGGVLHYSEELNKLIPDFWNYAPVERYITKYETTILTSSSSFSFSFKDNEFSQPPYNGFTLLRSKFDKWYAQKAREAGAFLVPETTVDDLVLDNGKVTGIKTGRSDGIVYADAVILADGANSLLAKKAGLRRDLSLSDYAVAAKEVLALPSEVIEERFDLVANEGTAHLFIGSCTQGVEGGAFLYTNRSSLSIGVVAKLRALQRRRVSIAELLENWKTQPIIKKLIKDSTLKEYSGHLIPEGGINTLPQLYGNGVLLVGDAAGFVCSTGITLEGMNFAIASGAAAAETVKMAKESGDFSQVQLASYKMLLENCFVLKELKTFRRCPDFLDNPRLYEAYPSILCSIAKKFYGIEGKPRKKILNILRAEMKGKVSFWQLFRDIIQAVRALIWI